MKREDMEETVLDMAKKLRAYADAVHGPTHARIAAVETRLQKLEDKIDEIIRNSGRRLERTFSKSQQCRSEVLVEARENRVFWTVWIRWPGTSEPQKYEALVDTGAQCTLLPSRHVGEESVSIAGVTGGSQEFTLVEADVSLTGNEWKRHPIVTGPEAPCILGIDFLRNGYFKDPKGFRWAFGIAAVETEGVKQLNTLPGLSENPSAVGLLKVEEQQVPIATSIVHRRQYRTTRDAVIPIHKMIRELESQGVVSKTHSPFNSPIWPVRKPDGEWRLTVDYRALNEVTPPLSAAVPDMLELQYELESKAAKWYATIDIANAFFSIPLAAECRPQFAFTWRGVQYTWNRLPQGWKHSPTICHGLIQAALEKGEAPEHLQYIDDIIVWGNTAAEVFEKGKKIIQILLEAGFAIKKSKVKGPAHEIQFLGIKWQDGRRQIPTEVINKITAMSPPTNKKETQAFLGAIGFWRMHIPEYSQIVSPLYLVTRKKNDFHWGPEQQQAFAQIKQEIAHAVALGPVRTGPDVKNVLYSAAGNNGLSWSLWQKVPGEARGRPLGFWSRSYRGSEANYTPTEKEILAAYEGVQAASEVIGTETQLLLAPRLPVLGWMFKGEVPSTHHATDATWSKWIALITQRARMGKLNRPGILEIITNWPEGENFGLTDEEQEQVTRAEEAPPYNQLPAEETHYALFTDGSCRIVGMNRKWKAAVWSPTRQEWKDIATRVERLPVKVRHVDAHIPKSRANEEHRNNKQVDRAAKIEVSKIDLDWEHKGELFLARWAHDASGHQGRDATYKWARDRGVDLTLDSISQVIHDCETCAAIKQAKRVKPLWYGRRWSKYKYGEAWQIDYITLPQTRQGKYYVLTMVEATTGWLETYPVPHATARNTILGLEKQVLWRHGTPERIESDNGTHFKNSLINTWAREHGIEWVYHIPYHAPAADKVERHNALLKTQLKALGGGSFKNWEQHLAKATWLVNTRGSTNRAGPAQAEPLHTIDGDKVPVVHARGTLSYSPPECTHFGWYHGEAATIWTLGILLHQMICIKHPFRRGWNMSWGQLLLPQQLSQGWFGLSLFTDSWGHGQNTESLVSPPGKKEPLEKLYQPGSADAEAALGSARALLGSALGTAGLALPSHCSDSFAPDEPFPSTAPELSAFAAIQPDGSLQPYSKIKQLPSGPLVTFVERLTRAIELQVKNEGAQEQVLEEMALAHADEQCKAAILSLSTKPAPTLHDVLQVCARKIPFIKAHQNHSARVKPPQKAAAADTVLPVPVPRPPPKRGTTCLLCHQAGHWISQCPLKKQFLDFRDNRGRKSQRSKGNFSKNLENVNAKLNNPALTSSAFQQKSPDMIVKDPATRETKSPHDQVTWGRGYTYVSIPPDLKWVPAEWVKPFIPKTAKPPAEAPQSGQCCLEEEKVPNLLLLIIIIP
ncbi:hypothetical protein DUI87_12651 [Hirundo rustica rustica]|uniref:ribonuclease H n=1 Tax=Hirundo rustica rustica TaxID=333673 RepID=A0A3M0KCL0_HIRRU|nr:hypothetical protein DUI87_12651 [Hirundo rustica rustica]